MQQYYLFKQFGKVLSNCAGVVFLKLLESITTISTEDQGKAKVQVVYRIYLNTYVPNVPSFVQIRIQNHFYHVTIHGVYTSPTTK